MKDLAPGAEDLGNILRHLWLVRAVAQAAGVDLDHAVQAGQLGGLDFARLVTSCRGAGCSKSCALWLSSRSDDAPAVPEFCRNKEVFEQLMP